MTDSPQRVKHFLAARLSPEGAFGLYMTLGLALIVLAAAAFAALAEDVVEGARITVIDVQLAHWFRAHATPRLTQAMLFITHADGLVGTSVMAAALAAWFWRRKAVYWLIVLAAAVPGGMLLNVLLKLVFQRQRPQLDDPLLQLATYSFPSGHTAAASMFYGVLACYLARRTTAWPRRALVAGLACAMVALVALSRMYLGVHYLSDVIAACLESAAWLALCITAVSTLHRRRLARGATTWQEERGNR